MLLRGFLPGRIPIFLGILVLGLAVGLLEGSFVVAVKSLVDVKSLIDSGSLAGTVLAFPGQGNFPATVLLLLIVVTLRSSLQIGAARWEIRAVLSWMRKGRQDLLGLAAGRECPTYRPPYRDALARALGEGWDLAGEGAAAGCRCLSSLIQALALFPLLWLFSWRLALLALALSVPALLASRFRAGMLAKAGRKWQDSRADLALEMEDFSEGLETAAGNGRLPESTAALGSVLDGHEARIRTWETAKAVFPPALEWFFFMVLAALAALAASGGSPVAAGTAAALPFAFLLLLIYRPIREWARNFPVYTLGAQAWRENRALISALEAHPARRRLSPAPGRVIVAESICFRYGSIAVRNKAAPPVREVFADLNLDLDPGQLTWISGRNGAGKSTLLKLLAGLEYPRAGRILWPPALLAASRPLGYLPQRPFLEPDYLEWCRAFRRERGEDWEALDAILGLRPIVAGALDADHAQVGNRAQSVAFTKGLSGGERQRLGLARVFTSPGRLLLLDEPTTWLPAEDREGILGDLLAFWRRRDPGKGAAIVSHEPFLGELCALAIHLEAESREVPVGMAARAGGQSGPRAEGEPA